jgi:O-antigen ligase
VAGLALGAARPWRSRASRDQRVLGWSALAAGVAIAAIGLIGSAPLIVGLGGAIIAVMGAFLTPQLLLALFLVAGGLKSAPWLAGAPGDLTVLTAVGLIAAIAVRAFRSDGLRPFPPATLVAAALAGLVVLSVLWSPAPDLGLEKALRFETLTMLAFVAPFVLVRSRGDLYRLMMFLLAASLVVALTAVPGRDPTEPLTVAGGHSEIELALYASSGLVAAVGYLMLVGRSPLRFLWLIPGLFLAETVISAGSRGVLIGSVLALLTIGVRTIAASRVKVVPIAVMVAAAIGAFAFASNLSGPAATKYQGLIGNNEATTLGKRNFLLQDGIDLAVAYPMGRGASGYQFETLFPYPHNAFVEVAAEQGIIGLALLVLLMAAAFRSSLRARGGPRSPESILAGGLLIVLVMDAMVSQTFTQFRELWLAMGLAIALPNIRTTEADASLTTRAPVPASDSRRVSWAPTVGS